MENLDSVQCVGCRHFILPVGGKKMDFCSCFNSGGEVSVWVNESKLCRWKLDYSGNKVIRVSGLRKNTVSFADCTGDFFDKKALSSVVDTGFDSDRVWSDLESPCRFEEKSGE